MQRLVMMLVGAVVVLDAAVIGLYYALAIQARPIKQQQMFVAVWIVLTLVSVHIAAAFGYLLAFRENLITPMLTGRKRLAALEHGHVSTAHAKAIALLVLCAIVVWLLVRRW